MNAVALLPVKCCRRCSIDIGRHPGFFCPGCSRVVDRVIARWLDGGDPALTEEVMALVDLPRDAFLTRVSRLRRGLRRVF